MTQYMRVWHEVRRFSLFRDEHIGLHSHICYEAGVTEHGNYSAIHNFSRKFVSGRLAAHTHLVCICVRNTPPLKFV